MNYDRISKWSIAEKNTEIWQNYTEVGQTNKWSMADGQPRENFFKFCHNKQIKYHWIKMKYDRQSKWSIVEKTLKYDGRTNEVWQNK